MTDDRFDHTDPPRPDPGRPDPGRPAREPASTAAQLPFVSNDELLRFVDGALDDDGRVRVLTHLATRPAAVERVEAYLHQNARLRSLRDHLPLADSAGFAAPLQAAIAARLGRQRARRRWQRWGTAAAVALLVTGGALGLALDLWHEPERQASNAPSLAVVPQAYFLFDKPELAAFYPEATATSASVDAAAEAAAEPAPRQSVDGAAFDWLAGQVSEFSISAPDFDRIGLTLAGGETLERQGSPAIRLIYRDQAENPVLLHIGVGKPDVDHAFWLVREGYVSLQWRRGPMVFAIVAPTDSPQLSQVVDIVGAAIARLPAPERSETGETTSRESAARAIESGPLQAIAVPPPPAPAAADPSEPTDRAAAEALPEAKDENEPEPL